jgi:magnesium chelatase family protein
VFTPGEVTLAHRGVLVMNELPEFHRDCLEALREPLEEGVVRIHRAATRRLLPAAFTLAATANPCPCGRGTVLRRGGRSNGAAACDCPPESVARYQRRISGPLRDRIDLVVEVRPVVLGEVRNPSEPTSAEVGGRVIAARRQQAERQGEGSLNSALHSRELAERCPLTKDAARWVRKISKRYGLSGRGFHGVLRVARSISDLDGAAAINADQLLEACEYRAS